MNLQDVTEKIKTYVAQQMQRLALYNQVTEALNNLELPEETYTYIYKTSDGTIDVEFSPNGQDKNLRPLVHRIAKQFNVEFSKTKNWDEESLVYTAEFEVGDLKLRVRVRGVVPNTCKIEETVEELSDEEIEEARKKALAEVKTTRVIRKIICD